MPSFMYSPVITVLAANAIWLTVCTIWALLCFGQAAKDRAAAKGFQKRIGINDID